MRWNITNWARGTYAQRLLEYRKCERRELKILVSQKSPSFQRESEYSITSSSESTLGCNLEGEIAPDASVSSSALKHSIVLQTPPISLLPTNPGTALNIFTQLLFDWLYEMSIKATALKKRWPLASTIKPIMEQEGWAVSRSPLPSRAGDQNKQWVSVFSRDSVCACFVRACVCVYLCGWGWGFKAATL